MYSDKLKNINRAVLRRAQKQGHVTEAEIIAELKAAGLPRKLSRDVLAEIRPYVSFQDGRYCYTPPDPSVREERVREQAIRRAVRQLIREHRQSADETDRRREGRVDFIQPAKVEAEDGRVFAVLCRDISPTGIRLIGARGFLGQKVRVTVSGSESGESVTFLVRILWNCSVGDQLFESGGSFLGMVVAKSPGEPFAA
jgi:hypothetical protein